MEQAPYHDPARFGILHLHVHLHLDPEIDAPNLELSISRRLSPRGQKKWFKITYLFARKWTAYFVIQKSVSVSVSVAVRDIS